MNGLVKSFSRDRTLQQFSQEFLQQGGGGSQEFFEFNGMGKELEAIHHSQTMPGPTGPDWALDFMQQSGGPLQHQRHEFHNDGQFQEFEDVFRNAQQQQHTQQGPHAASAWQAEFAAFEPQYQNELSLPPEQIEAFERAFEDAKNVSQWESEFKSENAPQSWADEFTTQESSMTDQDDKDALAKTAGMLLESVDTRGNDKFKNSSFMSFMRRLRDQEVAIEGNKLVEQTSPVAAPAGSDWAASFNQQQSQDKGKGKAADWSSEFESQQQQNDGGTWSTEFEKRIEQHIKNREPGSMWSSEFAKQQEGSWAEDFTAITGAVGGGASAQDWAQQFNTSRQETAQDWVNEFNSSNAADELEQAFQDHQQQDQGESWVEAYRKNIAHLAQDPSDKEWDALQKDWERQETSGLGYRATDPRYQSYSFEQNNPYMVADTGKLLDLAARGNLTESILALEAAVQKDPMDAAAWHQLGLRQQENERETMAIAALLKAVETNPKELNAWLALAVSYTNENCRVDAYDALQSWIENSDQYKGVKSAVTGGQGRLAQERHDYVTGLFLEAARTNPGENLDPDVQIALGILFNVSEEYEKAVDCFRAALNLRPDDYMLWNKYGATLANSHNTASAIEAYFNALNINPSYIRARYNLAIACINLGQHREAAEHLLSALSLQNAGDAARGLMVGASTAGPQPDGGIGGMSQNVWETLKMAMYMLGMTDLAKRCETSRDLDAFRSEFDF
ncbi:Peroxisomal membrane signal receptor PTS1 [Dissophora globulifera]|uniref:Peroxisomal membrane signal receptor PTS1 n=1 Tax=Dissophora globulifera TaxID=979702 RepID=A0A9P6RCG6_9FUNG|nr:Peroxisomal membrane signal receptor PTS1 [Dissophora globulifera]